MDLGMSRIPAALNAIIHWDAEGDIAIRITAYFSVCGIAVLESEPTSTIRTQILAMRTFKDASVATLTLA